MTWFASRAFGSLAPLVALLLVACSGPAAPTPPPKLAPTPSSPIVEATPPALSAPAGPVLVAGGDHACASTRDGYLECWGAGDAGQLGDGSYRDRSAPTRVLYVRQPVLAAAGSRHTCAQTAYGQLYCWGVGVANQLADEKPNRGSPLPLRVTHGPFVAMAAGNQFTCGLSAERQVTCWGVSYGRDSWQLQPAELRGADNLEATNAQVCATVAGASRCIDIDPDGPEASAATDKVISAPLPMPDDIRPVGAVAQGRAHACARTGSGVRCWGDDSRGQLATGGERPAPWSWSQVPGLDAVSLGATFTKVCAVRRTGELVCWGEEPNPEHSYNPRISSRLQPVSGVNRAIAVGAERDEGMVCVLFSDGGAQCVRFGEPYEGEEPPERIPGITDGVAIGVNFETACTLDRKGAVHCWSPSNNETPERVTGMPPMASIHVGAGQACGIDRRQRLWCWRSHDWSERPKLVRRRCRGGPRYLDKHVGTILSACKQDREKPLSNVRGFLPAGGLEMMSMFWAQVGKQGVFAYYDTDDGGSIAIRKKGTGRRSKMYPYIEPFAIPADTKRLVGNSAVGCAIARKSAPHCWGDPFGPTPMAVQLPAEPVELAASYHHICLRAATGTVYCQRLGNR